MVVAHRLQTIEDSDLVVVLDNGLITEVGPPTELLQRESSHFASLKRAMLKTKTQ